MRQLYDMEGLGRSFGRKRTSILTSILMMLLAFSPAHAQEPALATDDVDVGRSFVVEAIGATAGTALGFGAVAATHRYGCGEDLSCTLRTAATAVVLGTVGAAAGGYAAGQLLDTGPSGWGAVLGSIAGAVAAIGVDHLVTEEMGVNLGTRGHIVLFALTQGTITALASRMGAALR